MPTSKLKGFITGIASKLTQEARDRFSINVGPDDFKAEAPTQTTDDITIVNEVLKDYKRASETRMIWEREAIKSISFADGNQWSMYREIVNNLPGYKDVEDPFRVFMQYNKLSKMVDKVQVNVTSTEPDVTLQPITMRAEDVGAADECSDIKAHLDLLHDWSDIRDEAVHDAIVYGWGWIKHWWDPDAEAVGYRNVMETCPSCGGRGQTGPFVGGTPCPQCQGQGKVTGIQAYLAKMGEVQRCFVPGIEIYGDPDARSFKDWQFMYHVKRRPLTYIRKHYPYGGEWVEADSSDSYQGSVDSQLDAIAGESLRGGQSLSNSAYVIERWEKPTDVFPKGRRIAVANQRLLTDPKKMDWPFERTDSFPFVPIRCRKRNYNSYPMGLVRDSIGLQHAINNILSRSNDQINEEILTVLISSDSKIHPGDYHNKQNMRQIVVDGPSMPQIQLPPPVGQDRFQMMETLAGYIEDQFSVHDVSQGKAGDAESGVQLELQQQEDQSGNNQLLRSIEMAAQDSTEWLLALAAQFYKEPRLVATGQSPDPQQNQIAAHDFKNLQAGGRVRVKVVPGSAVGTSPAARETKLLAMANAHMFDPAQLPVTIVLLKLMQLTRDDEYIRELIAVAQKQEAMAAAQIPMPMQLEQVKQQNALALLTTKQQGDQAVQTLKNEGGVMKSQQDHIAQGQLIDQEWENELNQAELDKRNPPVTIALKGTMGAQGTIAAEEAVGLEDADTPQSIATENAQQTAAQVAVKSTAPPQQTQPKG